MMVVGREGGGENSVEVIRVKQQKNVPYVNKPELELTELLHLRAGAEGGGLTGEPARLV